MKNLLITTQIEDYRELQNSYNINYLGHWCLTNPFSNLSNNSYVIPYHWDNRGKLSYDHQYLENLYENVLSFLMLKLNQIHQKDYDLKYWRNIIGPWLFTYIPIIYDRWEMLKKAYELEENYFFIDLEFNNKFETNNLEQFLNISKEDEWNYQLYRRIIKDKYQNRTTLIPKKHKVNNNKKTLKKSFKLVVFEEINKILQIIGKKNKIFFYKAYFPIFRFINLNFRLYQIPVFEYNYFDLTLPAYKSSSIREKNNLLIESNKDEFYNFIYKYLFLDIPSSYLENYSYINVRVQKININPKIIFTANAYWYNDIFNIWVSQRVYNKQSKLYFSQHGGALPPKFTNFSHELKTAEKYISWFKSTNINEVQLPPNKLTFKKNSYNQNNKCIIIGYDYPKYSHRVESAAISGQTIDVFNKMCQFIENINDNLIDNFYFKPYPDQGWGLQSQFLKNFPNLKIINGRLDSILNKTKITICTYPQTTFIESISKDIPTILLLNKQYFELSSHSDYLVEKLIDAKILFTNYIEAANHIEHIWNNIDNWWQSDLLIETKKLINKDMVLKKDKNWSEDWINFFNKELKKN